MSADPLIEAVLCLDIHSFWHPGSGRGDGTFADNAVHRTAEKLPFLPGRTVKGLLREAARLAEVNGLDELFGSPPPAASPEDREAKLLLGGAVPIGLYAGPAASPEDREAKLVAKLEAGRFESKRGSLRFTSACLGRTRAEQAAWAAWAEANPSTRDQLYLHFSSTRIDGDGIARDKTLRTIELVAPVDLYAFVSGPAKAPWPALSEAVQVFLRAVGSHRNRGLGRVTASLEIP